MRFIRYIFVISIFMVFMPNVYAQSLEVFAKANNTTTALPGNTAI